MCKCYNLVLKWRTPGQALVQFYMPLHVIIQFNSTHFTLTVARNDVMEDPTGSFLVHFLITMLHSKVKEWMNGIPWVIFGTEVAVYTDKNLNNLNGMDIFIRFVHRKWVLLDWKHRIEDHMMSLVGPLVGHSVPSTVAFLRDIHRMQRRMDNAPLLAPFVIKIHSRRVSSVHHIIMCVIMRRPEYAQLYILTEASCYGENTKSIYTDTQSIYL